MVMMDPRRSDNVLSYYVVRRGIAAVTAIDLGRAPSETAGRRPRIGTKKANCRLCSVGSSI
jgi:hypothetical protein